MITEDSEDKLLRSVALRNADAIRIARQRAEQQAEATLQEQANLLNLTHDSIFVRDMNGTIRYWNRAAEQLYGWAKEQAVGRVAHDLLATAFPLSLEQIEGDLMRADRWEGELVHTRNDGSHVVVASRWSLQRDEQGIPVAIMETNNDITERKRAEAEAHDREGKIRRLVDANIIGIFIADRQGLIIEANDAFLRLVGYGREDLVSGRVHWTELSPPEWRERDVLTQAELNSTGIVQPFEKEYFRKDGSRVPVLVGATLFKEGGDRLAFVLDLTERKRAEDRLRRSEAWLSQAQRLSRSGNWVYSATTKQFIYWSDESYRIWGFDPLQGLPSREDMRQRIHPDDRDRVRETVQEAVRQKTDFTTEFRILLPDGTVKYLEGTSHHLFSSEGALLEAMNSTVDVTQRKRTEQALRESERSLRSAIDGIPGLVAILAPNGDLEAVNRQIFEYCGQSLEELRNWGTNGTIHPDDLPHLAEVFTKSIAAGVPYGTEARVRRFDGEFRWFEIRGIPVRDASDRIVRWYSLLTDTEDRTQALARLQQMQSDFAHINRVSMMGELAASLSHEIAQPIASARNNARAAQNFLKMQPPDLGEVREALSCVVGDAGRAGEIIDRIREQIKKTPPRNECFDLNVAINEVIVLARSVTLRNGVSVQTRLAEGLLSVPGDRVQLQQVLLNSDSECG